MKTDRRKVHYNWSGIPLCMTRVKSPRLSKEGLDAEIGVTCRRCEWINDRAPIGCANSSLS